MTMNTTTTDDAVADLGDRITDAERSHQRSSRPNHNEANNQQNQETEDTHVMILSGVQRANWLDKFNVREIV